jgi:predicted nuclease of restriction endonuclease-like (RecB) superfamily
MSGSEIPYRKSQNFEFLRPKRGVLKRDTKDKRASALPTASASAQFDEIVTLIETARREAGRAVNVHLIDLYWNIGEVISNRIERDGWGKGTVEDLAKHLARTQPGARGFSPQNLWRMRQFFETYRNVPDLSTLLRELSWSANLHILSGAKRAEEREFYLRMAVSKRWNVREVARQIGASAFERAVLNPPKLSPALREIHPHAGREFKDAYFVEFAGLGAGHTEADLHGALLRNLGRFITELGRDFCFVGSEYPVQVGNQDFAIDLAPAWRHEEASRESPMIHSLRVM